MTSKYSGNVYWSLLAFEDWNLHLAATDEGLCFAGSRNGAFEKLEKWVSAKRPGSVLIHDEEKLRPYAAELAQYLRGELEAFTVPIVFHGTPFQESVWKALCDIPYGETRSYSDIARHAGRPAAVRAVGAAIGANPILIVVPCHRVIGKNGALTGYRGGMDMKTRLLQLEGVPFLKRSFSP